MNLLSLPPEVILKVTDGLEGAHRKTTRLICKQLNSIVECQVFANIVLRYSTYQPDLICDQLEALATAATNAAKYARSLEVRGFSPDSLLAARSRSRSVERSRNSRSRSRGPLAETHTANKAVRSHLSKAIGSLVNVQEVWWHFGTDDPEWAKMMVMDSLATLPLLEVVTIYLGGGSADPLQLDQLSNLRKVTISGHCPEYRTIVVPRLRTLITNSPHLDHLELNSGVYQADSNTCALHDLLDGLPENPPLALSTLTIRGWCVRLDKHNLPHLRNLTSLTLYNNIDPEHDARSNLDEEEKEELKEHLGPYSSPNPAIWDALRREGVYLTEIVTDHVSDGLLDYLYSYSGLKVLAISGATAECGSESDRLATHFYTEVLPRHANTIETLDITAAFEGKWCFGDHNIPVLLQCLNLNSLALTINSEDLTSKHKKNIVWSLLGVSEQLPSLTHLSISSADSEKNRGGFCGTPSIKHLYTVNTEISRSVTTFGPLDPLGLAKVINTPARDYVARLDESVGGGLWYRSSMRHGSRLQL